MASGSTEFIDVTTADAFLAEIWSMEALIARESKLVFGKNINRDFQKEMSKGDTLHVPGISNMSARQKTAAAAVTYETATESNTDIVVDQYYYAAFAVEDIISVQQSQNLRARYAPKLGYALALQEDDSLAALIDDFSQTVGTLNTDLTDDNLIRADQYLNDADVPEDGRVIIVSPAQKAGFLKMDKFVNKDYREGGAVSTGKLGSIYGYEIFVSTNVDGANGSGHDCALMHREAIAEITQMKPKAESARDIDYLCDKVVLSQLWGVKEMRDTSGVWMKGL